MTGEVVSEDPIYAELVSANRLKIEEFIEKYSAPGAVGICSLDLIDVATASPIREINGLDRPNRDMLDELYSQLGIDLDSKSTTEDNRFEPHRIKRAVTFYDLSDGNVVRETLRSTTDSTRFSVDVGPKVLMK